MLDTERIYIDFQKVDDERRLILSCFGTQRDLALYNVKLEEGLILTFYSDDADDAGNPDDLIVQGTAHYDKTENRWVAIIDWNNIKHLSDYQE
jgi:hypothetical protein